MMDTLRSVDDAVTGRYEYDDGSVVFVSDLGVHTDASLDIVDGTAIVVTDDDQYEFELPDDAQAFMQNGVLTIEVSEPEEPRP